MYTLNTNNHYKYTIVKLVETKPHQWYSVLASCVVDRMFEPWSGKTIYTIVKLVGTKPHQLYSVLASCVVDRMFVTIMATTRLTDQLDLHMFRTLYAFSILECLLQEKNVNHTPSASSTTLVKNYVHLLQCTNLKMQFSHAVCTIHDRY
jgi:hypothetical protein